MMRSATDCNADIIGADLAGPKSLRIAVGLATAGRPQIAGEAVRFLSGQTRKPDDIYVCVPSRADYVHTTDADVTLIVGAHGLTLQRNAILNLADSADVLVFLDDDFVPASDYLAEVERAFFTDPELVCATGTVLADGITGPGIAFADAVELLQAAAPAPKTHEVHTYNAYGCNMLVRMAPVRKNRLRFDTALPRYGWLEDVDFSRQLAMHGAVKRISSARGVHLGVKSGRQPGRCFGYSQIANPFYLVRKGTYSWNRAAWLVSRNVSMNLIRSLHPEAYVDRRGRASGNLAALADLMRGRLSPQRIEAM